MQKHELDFSAVNCSIVVFVESSKERPKLVKDDGPFCRRRAELAVFLFLFFYNEKLHANQTNRSQLITGERLTEMATN